MKTSHKLLLSSFAFSALAMLPILANAEPIETKAHTFSYDSNGDGIIEADEFTTYIYTRSDLNNDGYLGDDEWKITTNQLYRPFKDTDVNTYTYWDQDKNGHLDSNEVKTLVEKTGLYSKWDANHDTKVDTEEFARGTFAAYDDNNDGVLSLVEWKSVLK